MSASDSKPATTESISPPGSQAEDRLESVADVSPDHYKDAIEAEALQRLREFFLLLDQWDQEQQG